MKTPAMSLVASFLILTACGSEEVEPALTTSTQAAQAGYVTTNKIAVHLRAAPCSTCDWIVYPPAGTSFHVYNTTSYTPSFAMICASARLRWTEAKRWIPNRCE